METQGSRRLITYLPAVVGATLTVVAGPMVFVFWLRDSGAVASPWLAVAMGVALSLLASHVGAALWKSRTDSDLLFSELMIWGWLQRWRTERRLSAASSMLGLRPGSGQGVAGGLDRAQKKQLLTELTSSLEFNDPYTHGHSRRVARYAANIARQMGLSHEQVAKIRAAGAMHDVGKLETPTAILHKTGKLTDEEYEVVKRHPVAGAEMVATLGDDELTDIVRHHHERLDGTGYPDGLAGDEIPLGARILAVADTFDAITSTRAYRRANPHKKALDILSAEAGTQLDPDAVRAFQQCYSGWKPLAFWTVMLHARPRAESLLGGGLTPAGGSNVLASAVAAAAVGAVVVLPAQGAAPAPSAPGDPGQLATTLTTPASFTGALNPEVKIMAALAPDPLARPAARRGAAGRARAGVPAAGRGEAVRGGRRLAGTPASGVGQDPGSGRPSKVSPGKGTTRAPGARNGKGHAYGRGNGKGDGNAYGHTKNPAPGTGNGPGKIKLPALPKVPAVPKVPTPPAVPDLGLGKDKPKRLQAPAP